jgi:hypothetical protein
MGAVNDSHLGFSAFVAPTSIHASRSRCNVILDLQNSLVNSSNYGFVLTLAV